MNKQQIHDQCQQILDGYTSDPRAKVPGIVFAAIDKNGELITANPSGSRALGGKHPMDLDTTFWIASLTKLVTAIVCMQLVEQGKIKLDDSQHLYEYCPELKNVKVLQDDGTLVERKKDITLRMLLTHTAGFGYEFFNEKLRDHHLPVGVNFVDCSIDDILTQPLVNQPGDRWEYGYNIDWAGFYCERVTGIRLNDLMLRGIMEPLGLKNTSMFPSKETKANLASMHQRWPGSTELHVVPQPQRAMLKDSSDDKKKHLCQAGGAGLFSRPTEYLQILATLLNDGTSPTTGAQILKPETVKDMFTNQIPQFPQYGRQGIPASKPEWTNPIPDTLPQPGNADQGTLRAPHLKRVTDVHITGWGLSLQLINEGIEGCRSAGTGNWAGSANLFFFVDRHKGVAAVVASQILPFGDQYVLEAAFRCEAALYAGLG